MNLGDLVKLDIPGQRAHGKIGIIVSKDLQPTREFSKNVQSFSYEVMVGSEVWRVGYSELLEEDDWVADETG